MPHYAPGSVRPRLRLKLSPTAPRYGGIGLGGTTDAPYLEWESEDWPLSIEQQPEYDDCLWDFIRLIAAPAHRFYDFASKWHSLLGLCADGGAAGHALSHSALIGALEFEDSQPGSSPTTTCPLAPREYLSDWRKWAREAWVLLVVAAHVRKGTAPKVDQWATAAGIEEADRKYWEERFTRPDEAITALRLRVGGWVEDGRVHPIAVANDAGQSDMALASPHLLGIIGAQLLDQITGEDGPYLCTQCGWPGRALGRRPRWDKGFFCSETCRRKAKTEVVKRSQRARRDKLRGQSAGAHTPNRRSKSTLERKR